MLPPALMERMRAFQESRVLLTAIELDVFEAARAGATAEQVAAAIGTDPRATGVLLNALVALGLMEKREGVFRNAPDAARYLVSGSPDDQRMAAMHNAGLWHRWSALTECVRTGTQVPQPPMADRGTDWTGPFIAAMDANAQDRAREVVDAVGAAGVRRMLDLGGGSGAYSIAFARANAELRAEILDLETVAPLTRRYIARAGLEARIEVRPGDMLAGSFGAGYDLVLLAAICHMFGEAENRALFQACSAALAPEGRVVVLDFLLDPDGTAPRPAALFALNMLVGTAKGTSYTAAQYREWLEQAGLTRVTRVDLPGPAGLMIGYKPATIR